MNIHKSYVTSLNLDKEQIFDTLDVLQEVVKGFDIVIETTKS